MNKVFDKNTLEEFYSITGVDLSSVLSDYLFFMDNYHGRIVDYYKGGTKIADATSFQALKSLVLTVESINSDFILNKDSFFRYDHWELLDYIEGIRVNLMTISNVSKFLRSSIENGNFSQFIETKYSLKQNQTLEDVSDYVVNSTDPINDWANIAFRNDLREEDYNTTTGKLLSVVFDKSGGITDIKSVVDNINGENMYGLDIYNKITFEDDDVKTLGYKDTMLQAVDILSKLRRGGNPEFRIQGLQTNLIVGRDSNSIAYPVIFRQLFNIFSTDDTIASFSITNVKIESDSLVLEAGITTKYGDFLQAKIKP